MTPEEVTDHLAEIGLGLLTLVATSEQMGHASPANSLRYMRRATPTPAMDLAAWCARSKGWGEARDRLLEHCENLGVHGSVASELTGLLERAAS